MPPRRKEIQTADPAIAPASPSRAKMPAPEDLLDQSEGPSPRRDGHRPGFEDTLWFRMDIGRRHNADPRWILPLLCRRGHITRNEIGAIRIGPQETHFQVPRASADKFAAALLRTAGAEDGGDIAIERSTEAPRDPGRPQRPGGKPYVRGGAPHKGPHKGPRAGNIRSEA